MTRKGGKSAVDGHPDQEAIERALVRRMPVRQIAEHFNVSKSAIHRHAAKLPAKLAEAVKKEDAQAHAESLVDRLEDLYGKAHAIIERAEKERRTKDALGAIKEARMVVETLAKITGELREGTTINVFANSEWIEVRQVILTAVADYPEAKAALAEALGRFEEPTDEPEE